MSQRVILERHGAVAHVRLNRADKRNALDPQMFEALIATGQKLRSDHTLRAVVLSGEGKAFCAGLDFASFVSMGPELFKALDERPDGDPANLYQRVCWIWQQIPVPVIAALHGVAFGGGLQIALGADLRYAHADTQLSVMEIRWGLIPDMGLTQTLSRLVRLDVMKELTFTGRRIGAEEALNLGLITRIEQDPVAAAMATAEEIAARSPHAIRAAKKLLNEAPAMPVADSFRLESDLQRPLLGSRNQQEATMANMQKRAPKFADISPPSTEGSSQ